jgi:hypothetical protein
MPFTIKSPNFVECPSGGTDRVVGWALPGVSELGIVEGCAAGVGTGTGGVSGGATVGVWAWTGVGGVLTGATVEVGVATGGS